MTFLTLNNVHFSKKCCGVGILVAQETFFLSLRDKSKVFHVRLHYELKRYSYTVLEAQNFPKLENLDIESQISEFKGVIHNGLRRTSLIYRSDKQQVTISQHRWNG